jgi:hypothetical protein
VRICDEVKVSVTVEIVIVVRQESDVMYNKRKKPPMLKFGR